MYIVGFGWLKLMLIVFEALPMVVLIIPHELISAEHTVMDALLPIVPPVVLRVIVDPEILV